MAVILLLPLLVAGQTMSDADALQVLARRLSPVLNMAPTVNRRGPLEGAETSILNILCILLKKTPTPSLMAIGQVNLNQTLRAP